MNISKETDLKITWFIAVVMGVLILYQGIQDLVRGAPLEDWITMTVIGTSILLIYAGMKLAYWVEDDEPSMDRFGLSDWTALILTGTWIIIGVVFHYLGLSSLGVLLFALFGVIGVVGILYKMHNVKNR